MKYLQLREKIRGNIFTYLDVVKMFAGQDPAIIKTQISRFAKKGLLTNLKRGLYCFDPKILDEFELANRLYQPSYISLETALHYYGIIPDIPQAVTSISLTTTKKITTEFGTFYYTKIKSVLFWGYRQEKTSSGTLFHIAKKEKALLDYLYIRKFKDIDSLRLDVKSINRGKYRKYRSQFPAWLPGINL